MKRALLFTLMALLMVMLMACSLPSVFQMPGSTTADQPERQRNALHSAADDEEGPTLPEMDPSNDNEPPAEQAQPPQEQEQTGCRDLFALNGAVNVVEGQEFQPGESFEVVWPIRNAGTCSWSADYSLRLVVGDALGASDVVELGTAVAPGESILLTLQMTAPSQPGSYRSIWKLHDSQGRAFGTEAASDSPLKVIIRVAGSGGNQPPPTQGPTASPTPEPTPTPVAGALAQGTGQTITVNQCFDLVSGQAVACSDPAADFKFTYASGQGGNLVPLNGLEFSGSRQFKPTLEGCEGETYYGMTLQLPLPAETSVGKYYAFHTEHNGDTVYGWIQPTAFNGGGITFDFVTYEPSSSPPWSNATLVPVPNPPMFVLSQGTDQTLLADKCFDLAEGQKAACNGAEADFKYTYSGGQASLEFLNGLELSGSWGSSPSKVECESETYYSQDLQLPETATGRYYCFRTDYNGDTVYGWIQPTSYDSGGITFSFVAFEP
jgi:hypothetical protein